MRHKKLVHLKLPFMPNLFEKVQKVVTQYQTYYYRRSKEIAAQSTIFLVISPV